jgi:hypothetical protein
MVLMVLTSTLYMNYSFLRIFTAMFSGLLLFSFVLSKQKTKFKFNKNIFVLFYFFLLASCISALINADTELMLGAVFMGLLFFSLFITFPSLSGWKSNEIVYKAVVIVHIPIIFIPLVEGLGNPPYMGIFDNGNSFGIACLTLFAAVISKATHSLFQYVFKGIKISKRLFIYYFISIPSLLVLTMYSGSRTSFITAVTILLTSFGLIMMSFIKRATKRQFGRAFRLSLLMFVLAFIAFTVFPIKEKFEQIILYKFRLKSDDILSERGFIWESALNNANAFGHGRDYFSGFEHGAHNTFISLLGQYGWVPTLLFILILVLFLIQSLRYSFKAINDPYRFLPLMMLITFLLLSNGEGMLFKGPMISAFAAIGAATVLSKDKGITDENTEVATRKKKRSIKKLVWN